MAKFIEKPVSINIDVKNYAKSQEEVKQLGLTIIQTQYYLKKDAYALLASTDFSTLFLCNVSETVILKAKQP
jgi:hypothetical protein